MTKSYGDLWMKGPEVIAQIAKATGCDNAQALARLVHECREGSIEGRTFITKSARAKSWAEQRGFDPESADWWENLVSDGEVLDASEFPREVVLRLWPAASHARANGAAQPRNRPGPPPKKREATILAMRRDYAGAPDKLADEKQETLKTKYKASPETVTKARISALEHLRRNTD